MRCLDSVIKNTTVRFATLLASLLVGTIFVLAASPAVAGNDDKVMVEKLKIDKDKIDIKMENDKKVKELDVKKLKGISGLKGLDIDLKDIGILGEDLEDLEELD